MSIIIDNKKDNEYNYRHREVYMKLRTPILMPQTELNLKTLGNQIKLARLRRNLSMKLICDRANVSRATLSKIESGDPSVAIGYYATVLHALNGMDSDLKLVARDDVLGHTMQDLKLNCKKRARN